MKIYCCNCGCDVEARLTDGEEIYPHREDLHALPFWKCDTCKGKVGCHHKTSDRTRPLGVIPSAEVSKLRSEIHSSMDVIWKSKTLKRSEVYEGMSKILGYKFHSAEIRSVEEAYKCLDAVRQLRKQHKM